MAKEVVIKIKEAEDAAAEIVRTANEKARIIADNALKDAVNEKDTIIKNALKAQESYMANAKKEAEIQCAPIIAQGKVDIEKILNPNPAKFDMAVKTVMERIVNVNGNR